MAADNALFQATVRAQHKTLIEGFLALKPKKRAPKAAWVIFAGTAYFIGAVFADASVREALLTPRGEGRAPQYVATATHRPAPPLQQVAIAAQPASLSAPAQPAVVTFPAFAVPASDVAANVAPAVDGPLPHAKAHHTAPTKRARSRTPRHAR